VAKLAEIFYERRILSHRKVPELVRMVLDNDVIPKLGKKKLATLSVPVIATMIEQVVDRGVRTCAGKVLAIRKQLFSFSEARGWIDLNPAYALDKKDLSIVDNFRDRHLSAEEVQALWHALDNYERLAATHTEAVGYWLAWSGGLIVNGLKGREIIKRRPQNWARLPGHWRKMLRAVAK